MRKKIVAGNWKMNMDLAEGLKFAGSIDKYFKENPSERLGLFYALRLFIWQVFLKF